MDEPGTLKELLTRAAESVDAAPPPMAYFADRRRQRRRTRWSGLAAVLAVLVVAGAATVVSRPGSRSDVASPPTGASRNATAQALASDRWTRLPPAPIAGRTGAVGVWTGRQMIVWGGTAIDEYRPYDDGAAYDPVSRTWTKLPAAPLTARARSAWVMAGDLLFVWGGFPGPGNGSGAVDGAVYDTVKREWITLPTAPVTSYRWAQALWTGSRVILLTTAVGDTAGTVRASAYDPTTGKWSALPDLVLPSAHPASLVAAVAAGVRVYVWSHWSRSTEISPSTFEGHSGVDGFTLDTSTQRWTPNSLVPEQQVNLAGALWTGRDILVPAGGIWCGGCSTPAGLNPPGYVLHPDGAPTESVPASPIGRLGPEFVWTGAALLAFNTGTYESGGGVTHYPGEAAAWDPSTRGWVSLPRAPLAGNETVAVWTGSSLLIWGQMFVGTQTNGSGPVHMQTAGLQFGRG